MYTLGIDIGGTKCAAVLGKDKIPEDLNGFIIDKISFPTDSERGYMAVIDELCKTVGALLEKNGISSKELLSIGISCGGPLDSRAGRILSPPNLPGWDDVPVTGILTEKYGVPAHLQNDANACALAEWRFGAAKGCKNAVFLTFGTGMGAGLILDGRLYTGANDMAGEVGHIRLADDGPEGYGKCGSFEGFCSGGGISRLFSFMGGSGDFSAKDIAIAAKNGDNFAKSVYGKSAQMLGQG
ncbi:MAG: ROK family protein, partial [Oscillospiraceae bacterium]|nr:ROK family protein [Oscillospiraceae bacterium]